MNRADFVPTDANLGLLQDPMKFGLSDTFIGERLGINRSTIWRWRACLNADLPLEDRRRGNSGVQKVSYEQLLVAVRRLEHKSFASLEHLNREVNFGDTAKTLSKAIKQRTDIRFLPKNLSSVAPTKLRGCCMHNSTSTEHRSSGEKRCSWTRKLSPSRKTFESAYGDQSALDLTKIMSKRQPLEDVTRQPFEAV
ncbi:hypothetical protein TKK_0002334 [Trichogramma kaykai]|uniref:Homeodomain-like domain-containing protein n=1 Tax=Trichogramma kaykai TaxID=54128 RepID=A0ABD2XCJ9_9HYME